MNMQDVDLCLKRLRERCCILQGKLGVFAQVRWGQQFLHLNHNASERREPPDSAVFKTHGTSWPIRQVRLHAQQL
jgi:hypothetical protein